MIEAVNVDAWAVDAGARREGPAVADLNVVDRGWYGTHDFGAVWMDAFGGGAPRIGMDPPARLVTRVLVRRADGRLEFVKQALGIDRGRVWAMSPWSQWTAGQRLSARVSVDDGGPGSCEALAFRVFVETREVRVGPAKVVSNLAAEVVVRPGDGPVEITAHGGLLVTPLVRTRLVLEVEAVGTGRPLTGWWARTRIGDDEGFASVSCSIGVERVVALATEHGGPTADRVPIPDGLHRDPAAAVVYAEEPDDPYLLVVPFAVDGTSVSGPLGTVPPSPPGARVEGAVGGFGHDLRLGSGIEGDYPVYQTVFYQPGSPFHTHYQAGTIHGWTGGVQPGDSMSSGPATQFALREMEGDGEAGAAFVGLLLVVVDQEAGAPDASLASVVASAFRDALGARLTAMLPVGARSGLTLAESAAVRAEVPAIADAVLTAVGAPLIAASADQLVGVGVLTWNLAELLAVGAATGSVDLRGSGSAYRVEASALVV